MRRRRRPSPSSPGSPESSGVAQRASKTGGGGGAWPTSGIATRLHRGLVGSGVETGRTESMLVRPWDGSDRRQLPTFGSLPPSTRNFTVLYAGSFIIVSDYHASTSNPARKLSTKALGFEIARSAVHAENSCFCAAETTSRDSAQMQESQTAETVEKTCNSHSVHIPSLPRRRKAHMPRTVP